MIIIIIDDVGSIVEVEDDQRVAGMERSSSRIEEDNAISAEKCPVL